MRRLKQALSLLLSLIMVLGMFTVIPFTASAEVTADIFVGTWSELQTEMSKDANQGKTIALTAPLNGLGKDRLLLEGSGKNITIDLAGYDVDMKRTSKGSTKHVFEAKGGATLTIKDSVGGGKITGGWEDNGGGIYVNTNSKVILDGVTVSGNKAGTDGGGIYVRGTLEMTNTTVSNNTAGDTGGGIYVYTSGDFTLTDSVITGNSATKTGGGINMHLKSDSTISGCQITNNTAGTYGGGIRMDAEGKTLTINSSTNNSTQIDHNTSSDDGAGIYLHYGTIEMTGGSISYNQSDNDSGGVKVTSKTFFTADGVTIKGNKALSEEAGGVKNFGTTTLKNCTITENTSVKQGGGVFNDNADDSAGELTLNSCTVTLNTSQSTGGGVYSDKKLKLKGGTYRQNYAGDGRGCGIFIGGDSDATEIEGALIVDGNSLSTNGQEIYLRSGRILTLSGALTGSAKIGVTKEGGVGTFTSGYNTYHNGTDPSEYFFSPDGFDVITDTTTNEAQLVTSWPDLQTEINNAASGDTVTLAHKYTAASSHDRLKIDGNKTVTIDLNGFVLNRNLNSEKNNGHVIEVFGGSTLIIKDSSATANAAGTGKITGGYSARGGGIYVNKNAALKIESGTITGNEADVDGGGIYLAGDLEMTGGTITDNEADDTGGGIYVSADGKFDLQNAKITDNDAFNTGGAIRMHLREDSTINNCTISGNKAVTDIGGGISMDAKDKTLTITDSHIDNNNSADDGGGIYLHNGTVVMTGGTVSRNFSSCDSGGVKVTKNTTFTATNVTFNGNTADSEEGGAIKNFGTTALKNCNITNNSAGKQGGGVFNDATDGSAGKLTVEDCKIAGNSASKGGGIYTDGTLTLKGTNTIGATSINIVSYGVNKAKNEGGGIYIDSGAVTTNLQDSLIMTGNTGSKGGDLYIKSDDKLTLIGSIGNTNIGVIDMGTPGIFTKNYGSHYDVSFEPNTFFGTAAGSIPVEWSENHDEAQLHSAWPTLQEEINTKAETGGTVTLTKSYTAGSNDLNLYIPEDKTVTIDLNGYTLNRNLSSNPSVGVGIVDKLSSIGSVIVVEEDAALTIRDSSYAKTGTIKGNKATYYGGGIYSRGTLTMTGGTVSGNSSSNFGGGIYIFSGSVSLSNATVTDNDADSSGGGLYMAPNQDASISNCSITKNSTEDNGGGVYFNAKNKTLTITDTSIDNNSSVDDGGGIFLQWGTIEMSGGTIDNNHSTNDGGGVKVTPKTKFVADDVKIRNNDSSTEQGGGIKTQGTTELTGCTVSGNTAKEHGGGIFNDSTDDSAGKLTLDGCTIKNNSSSGNGGGVYSDEVLTLKGANTITDNYAAERGGGVYLGNGSDDDTKVEGAIVIKDNKAGDFGNNLYLNTDVKLYVTGALTGSTINVDKNGGTGTITDDYSDYNSAAPSTYFIPAVGYKVEKKDGEAKITSGWSALKSSIESYTGTATYDLTDDYAASSSDDRIKIKAGQNITIDLKGHTLNRNRMSADKDGHIFEVFGTLTIIDSVGGGKLTGGWAKKGGGVNVNATGTFNLEGGSITGNRAGEHGGGVYVHGTFNMKGGKIEDNYAEKSGGGIALDSGSILSLSGGSITGNKASSSEILSTSDGTAIGRGGGILAVDGSTVNVKGNPVVKGNKSAQAGADVYLPNGKRLNITGALTEGASIGVVLGNDFGEFTSGYSTYNSDTTPAAYFKSSQGYAVALKNGEAELKLDTSYGETDTEKPFLGRTDQVNTNAETLSSVNWMSGISGDRYLNEINIPGSHDSGMNRVQAIPNLLDTTATATLLAPHIASKFAKTQKEYINQQLEEGARQIDVRLYDDYKGQSDTLFYTYQDDGKNLWLCHGKKAGGRNFALKSIYTFGNVEGFDYLSLNQVLDWVKDFLKKHPTETILLDLRPESEDANHQDAIHKRARRILEASALEINPSTGEPYLYKEPGSNDYFAAYTHMPQLKDCRGKIVIEGYTDDFVRQVGGFTLEDTATKFGYDYQDRMNYKQLAPDMVANAIDQYTDLNGDGSVKLPKNADERCDHLWYWELNCTGEAQGQLKNYTFWGEAPHIMAEYVNAALIGEGKLFGPEKAGQYIGWVRLDNFEEQFAETIWRTNFVTNPEYYTVTVKSGLVDENYPDQTYQVEKGATITIPGNIYKNIPGKYISDWKAEGENTDAVCKPKDSFKVTEDVTFTAQWLDEGQIPVRIDWKDGDNTDRLRASSVSFTVTKGDGTSSVTLAGKDDWQTVLTVNSNITDIVPSWSTRIVTSAGNPNGRDAVGQYRYEKALIEGEGYVFTFVHTPQTRTQLSGTVVWDDEGNESNRPASVTIKLLANGVEQNQTVSVDADDDWRFTFSDLAEYADGEKITYTISVDEIDDYTTIIDGTTVTNTYSAIDNSVTAAAGSVFWDDGKNAKGLRPQTVTARLKNGSGVEVASESVVPDEDGNWEFSFGAIPINDTQSYTVTIDEIPEYTFTVENTYSPVFQIFCTLIVPDEEKAPAELDEEPTALDLTYTGETQTLIEAGKATGGELMYALGENDTTAPVSGYSEELPAATDVGTYYVWYYVKGDALHTDTEKQCLTVSIANHYFMRHSLSLNGDIGVNFYLKLTEVEINSSAKVKFELNGEVISTYTIDKTRDANTIDGMTLYKASCKVCAPEMADTITAALTIDGNDVETDTYSAKQYADVILSSDYEEKFLAKEGNTEDDYAELATLVQTMLNYGAATQEQFVDEHPDNTVMANDDIDYDLVLLKPEELSALDMAVPDKDAINAQLEGTGLTYYGYTMLLHSETKLRFYFQKAAPDTDITGIHLSIGAGESTVTYNAQNYNKKYAYVEVPAVPAYELNNVYTLTVGDENLGSYSALTYVKDVLTDNELAVDDPLVATATAMYRYHKAAVIWFSSHNNS